MARNQFGAICDMCGNMTDNPKRFYHLRIPNYHFEIGGDAISLDYCSDCYRDLKIAIAKHYNCEWILEKEKING